MTRQANILSFDEVKAREASSPRTVSPSSASRREYDRYAAALGEGESRAHRGQRGAQGGQSFYPQQRRASSYGGYPSNAHAGHIRSGRYGDPSMQHDARRSDRPGRTAHRGANYAESDPYQRDRRARGGQGARSNDAARSHQQGAHRGSGNQGGLLATARKKLRSAKAEREFDRTVGARERAAAQREQAQGSRAAVYDMRMGATHRKSARMAEEEGAKRRGVSLPFSFGRSISAWGMRCVVGAAAVVFAAVMLYPSCQSLYNETRSLQQLEAEYDALQTYNSKVQAQVDYLSSDEGIEDYARSELGWVRPDEHVVTVEGVTSSDDSTHSGQRLYAITSGSVKAPETWYSGFLDVFFNYGN